MEVIISNIKRQFIEPLSHLTMPSISVAAIKLTASGVNMRKKEKLEKVIAQKREVDHKNSALFFNGY